MQNALDISKWVKRMLKTKNKLESKIYDFS